MRNNTDAAMGKLKQTKTRWTYDTVCHSINPRLISDDKKLQPPTS